jgi:hypothetical protein
MQDRDIDTNIVGIDSYCYCNILKNSNMYYVHYSRMHLMNQKAYNCLCLCIDNCLFNW